MCLKYCLLYAPLFAHLQCSGNGARAFTVPCGVAGITSLAFVGHVWLCGLIPFGWPEMVNFGGSYDRHRNPCPPGKVDSQWSERNENLMINENDRKTFTPRPNPTLQGPRTPWQR